MRLDPARVSAALAAVFTSFVALHASAQVMTLPTEFGGELDDEQQAAFSEALQTALTGAFGEDVTDEAGTVEIVGSASCDDDGCSVPIAILRDATEAQAVVHASVNGEDELYDFIIKIYDTEGAVLSEQFGDCMICPSAEALDAFSSTVTLACEGISFEDEAEAVEEVADAPAFEAGDIVLRLAASPENAEIRVNGELVGTGRAMVEVAPQTLELSVTAPGHEPSVEEMNVTSQMAGPILMRFSLSPTAAEARPGGASLPAPAISTGMMILGGAAIVGGGVLLALDGQSSCDDTVPFNECPEVYETTLGGYGLTVAGGAVLGMGLGLLLFNQPPSADGVGFSFSPSSAQVTFRQRF